MTDMRTRGLAGLALAAALLAPRVGAQPPGDADQDAGEAEAPPRYRVELIVFAHTDVDVDTEALPLASNAPAQAATNAMPERRWPFGIAPEFAAREVGELGEPVFADGAEVPFGDEPEGAVRSDPSADGSGASTQVSEPDPSAEGSGAATEVSEPDTSAQGSDTSVEDAPAARDAGADGTADDAGTAGRPKIELFGPPEFQQRPYERWFEPLPAEALELVDARRRLERIGAYRVLAHAGWEQDGLSEQDARPVSLAELGISNPSGTLTMYVSRFVHVIADLSYRTDAVGTRALGLDETTAGRDETSTARDTPRSLPAAEPSRSQAFGFAPAIAPIRTAPSYVLRTQRRTRTDELHYIDHPLFGILVRVIEAPEAPEDGPEAVDVELAPAA